MRQLLDRLYMRLFGNGQAYRGPWYWAAADALVWLIRTGEGLENWVWDRLRLRWRIADFVNRYRDTCWYRLVQWANNFDGGFGWLDVWYLRGTAGYCARRGETPYCAKCAATGLHAELGGRMRT